MITKITHVSLPVSDQGAALKWFTEKLGFKEASNSPFPEGHGKENDYRWITVSPPHQPDLEIVLQPPDWGTDGDKEKRATRVGNVSGLIFRSKDVMADYNELQSKGVEFVEEPKELPWGLSMLFKDMDGNVHNVVQPPTETK